MTILTIPKNQNKDKSLNLIFEFFIQIRIWILIFISSILELTKLVQISPYSIRTISSILELELIWSDFISSKV